VGGETAGDRRTKINTIPSQKPILFAGPRGDDYAASWFPRSPTLTLVLSQLAETPGDFKQSGRAGVRISRPIDPSVAVVTEYDRPAVIGSQVYKVADMNQ
jgi:hypothetical protein